MSALPPKADIRQRIEHACFVPLSDIRRVDGRLLAVDDAHQKMLRCGKCHRVNPSDKL